MNLYEKQAQDFLDATGATITARHERTGKHFANEKETRDVWKIKITRGEREYEFDFGSSIADREAWDKEPYPASDWDADHNKGKPIKMLPMPKEHGYMQLTTEQLAKAQARKRDMEREYAPAGTGHRPTAYDILTCLTKYSPGDNVDDFAAEFGYEKPSEALATFQAVQKEWDMVQKLFTDQEITALQEIA